MPEVIIPDGYGIATVLITHTTRQYTFTMGYEADTTQSAGDNAEDFDHALTVVNGFMATTSILTDYRYEGVRTYEQRLGVPIGGEFLHQIVGAKAAQPTIPNAAPIVQKRTAIAARWARGRMFLPPFYVGEGNIDGFGVIDSTNLAFLQTAANNFMTDILTSNNTPVILHSDASHDPTPITSLVVQSVVGTQRRRLR